MAELVDIEEAKAFAKFNAGVDDEALFAFAHLTGNQLVLDYLEWDPFLAETTEVVDGHGAPSVAVTRAPVTELLSVKVLGAEVPLSSLTVQGRMILRRGAVFPREKASVEVHYWAGYNPVPDPIAMAVKMATKAVWTAEGFELNFAAHSIAGVESASFHRDGPGSLPPAAKSLLRNYRRVF